MVYKKKNTKNAKYSKKVMNVKIVPKKKYIAKTRTVTLGPKTILSQKLRGEAAQVTVAANPGITGPYVNLEYSVSLSDIVSNELAAYTELYDEFKITGFRVSLKPRGNLASPGSTGANQGFNFYSVIDYTDLQSLSTVSEALEYANVRTHQSWRTFSRYVSCKIPKLIQDINQNPVLKVESPAWMQLAPQMIAGTNYDNTIVAHLGLKLIFEYNPNTTDVIFDEFLTIFVKFRTKK